jgi:hypothetical protein
MFLAFYPVPANVWLMLPVVGQQLVVERALQGETVAFAYSITLACLTAATALPVLAGAARALNRDDLRAG